MKVLVTGSTGLVGSEAVDFFHKKGWEVIGVDNNSRSAFFGTPQKVPQLHLDITDMEELLELFRTHKFDAIIHAAAQPSHDYSKDHPIEDFMTNAAGTLFLLEMTRHYSPEAVFVHVSTDKVYGWGMKRGGLREGEEMWEHSIPFNEETPLEAPFSPFGASKLYADTIAQEYAAQGWVTTGIFRMGCITGRKHEGAEQHGFLAYLAKCIKEGKTYKIFGYKGKQVRDQIHAHDLVSAFYSFVLKPKSGEVYNMGGGYERAVSPLSAGRMISEKTGKPFLYEYVEEPRFGDRQWDVHDVSKFRKDYPEWEYKYSIDDIIADLCQES